MCTLLSEIWFWDSVWTRRHGIPALQRSDVSIVICNFLILPSRFSKNTRVYIYIFWGETMFLLSFLNYSSPPPAAPSTTPNRTDALTQVRLHFPIIFSLFIVLSRFSLFHSHFHISPLPYIYRPPAPVSRDFLQRKSLWLCTYRSTRSRGTFVGGNPDDRRGSSPQPICPPQGILRQIRRRGQKKKLFRLHLSIG